MHFIIMIHDTVHIYTVFNYIYIHSVISLLLIPLFFYLFFVFFYLSFYFRPSLFVLLNVFYRKATKNYRLAALSQWKHALGGASGTALVAEGLGE